MKILVVGATGKSPEYARAWEQRKLSIYRKLAFLGTEIEITSPDEGPCAIQSGYDAAIAAPNILRKVKEAEDEGFDAVIISCGMDPAIDECRQIVKIPVVGNGMPSHLMAAFLGHKYSILMPGQKGKRPTYHRVVRKLGFDSKLASIRGVGLPILEIRKEFVEKNFRKTKRMFIEEARKAIEEDGADVIVAGCGYFAELAKEVEKELGVPVINPVGVALKMAETLVSLGLIHSKIIYPNPELEKRTYG